MRLIGLSLEHRCPSQVTVKHCSCGSDEFVVSVDFARAEASIELVCTRCHKIAFTDEHFYGYYD
jgi:hypothetical protein